MKLIENNIQKIVALCRKYKVSKLFAFGSILTDRFNDNSDVDLVVSFTNDKKPLSEKKRRRNKSIDIWMT